MNNYIQKAAVPFGLLTLVAAMVYIQYSMYNDDKIRVSKFNGAEAIRAAGYKTEGGVEIAPCHGKYPFNECGANDEYIVGFVTTVNGVRREGYVTIKKKTSTASKVTLWPVKDEGK